MGVAIAKIESCSDYGYENYKITLNAEDYERFFISIGKPYVHRNRLSNREVVVAPAKGRLKSDGWSVGHKAKKKINDFRFKWPSNEGVAPHLTPRDEFELNVTFDDQDIMHVDVSNMLDNKPISGPRPVGPIPSETVVKRVEPDRGSQTSVDDDDQSCWGYALVYPFRIKFGIGWDPAIREKAHNLKVMDKPRQRYRFKFPSRRLASDWEKFVNGRNDLGYGLLKNVKDLIRPGTQEWVDTTLIHADSALRVLLLSAVYTFGAVPDTHEDFTFSDSTI